ncbi:MAG TPA: hypothetical protein VJU61_09985 [Polyangiaceae bacterium]|nr:hypothetical protein [Polyangiaceae bacterium]
MMHGFVCFLQMRAWHYERCGLCQRTRSHCFLCDVHIKHLMRTWHNYQVASLDAHRRKNGGDK